MEIPIWFKVMGITCAACVFSAIIFMILMQGSNNKYLEAGILFSLALALTMALLAMNCWFVYGVIILVHLFRKG